MKKDEILVKAEGVSKKFCKDLKTSLWYGVKDLFSNLTGNKEERLLRKDEFWAVKDISFELRRGECLGLIGHNGAGKSTLLKILNGLIKPDDGKVTIKGRVGALIELGAGFNPILTGRENIYNNGAILGFTRREINDKVEEIIDFAEIREFIDMPVQNYSSGMKVRLGFAVAAQMQPDVLIIDEVLAVGDLGFVLKCYKTIDKILPNTAIVFVSHSMPMVSRICNKVILMHSGETIFQGEDVSKAIDLYYNRFANVEQNVLFSDGSVSVENIKILNSRTEINGIPQLYWMDDFTLFVELKVHGLKEIPEFYITISDKEQRPVALLEPNNINTDLKIDNGKIVFRIEHSNIQLSKGTYSIDLTIVTLDVKEPIFRINNAVTFQVVYERETWPPFLLKTNFLKAEL